MSNDPSYRESYLRDGTRLVTLGGELDVFTAGAEVQELLEECAEGACHVVLDMSAVTFIDSSGLALLIKTDRRLSAADRRLVVLRPHPNVRRILELTGLDQLLSVADSSTDCGALIGARIEDETF
ncbi:MAG TPA: STAS domain-containing protein [Solirubrobacteraceae bacterium]|nr:STAS domain-containing protein [Solirubrobacteraceae bacterium]